MKKEVGKNRTQTKKYEVNSLNTGYLKKELENLRYDVISVRGAYIEGFNSPKQFRVDENSFFVVNSKDDPKFKSNIAALGEKYCQDSVLISPKGGRSAFLYGTNNSDFPGYHQEINLGRLFVGDPSGTEQFHTRVANRPFNFREKQFSESVDSLVGQKVNYAGGNWTVDWTGKCGDGATRVRLMAPPNPKYGIVTARPQLLTVEQFESMVDSGEIIFEN